MFCDLGLEEGNALLEGGFLDMFECFPGGFELGFEIGACVGMWNLGWERNGGDVCLLELFEVFGPGANIVLSLYVPE